MRKKIACLLLVSFLINLFNVAIAFGEENPKDEVHEMVFVQELSLGLQQLLQERNVAAVIYLCDTYLMKMAAASNSESVAELHSGQTVWIKDIAIDEEGNVWYLVSANVNENEVNGYVERSYLAYSDEIFIRWEEENLFTQMEMTIMSERTGYSDIAQFPSSYQNKLTSLKNLHPNWIFVRMDTGLDWNEVIANEMGEKSLVPSSSPDSWKSGVYSSGWSYATEDIVKYYMDPRNSLTENAIFQFEQLTYNASYHTPEAVQAVVANTFMSGLIPGDSRSYAQAFWEIGNLRNVSPFHLAGRVYQEQGKGTSPLISGTYAGYENLYNYFNIGASGSTNEQIYVSGLTRARKEGWTTRYASLLGGAGIISANYISVGQDTIYLQKFDVDSSHNGLYWHQYMQNICAPQSEGSIVKRAYERAGALNNTFVFKIPVYNNMPGTACVKPGEMPPVDEEKVKAFVTRLYNVALGRQPDSAGLSFWVKELANRKRTGATAAKGFIFSAEMERRNLSNEQFVIILYQTFLNRTPAEGDSGKAFWINLLENGVSREYVFRGFCHSQEFTSICETYGIERGSITLTANKDQQHDLTMYVYRCYDRALGRKPDDAGLNYWTGEMLNGTRSAFKVAELFIFSAEFERKNTTNEEFVKVLYRMFMDREADASGLAFWVKELNTGARNRRKIVTDFANSAEFQNVLKSFGIN